MTSFLCISVCKTFLSLWMYLNMFTLILTVWLITVWFILYLSWMCLCELYLNLSKQWHWKSGWGCANAAFSFPPLIHKDCLFYMPIQVGFSAQVFFFFTFFWLSSGPRTPHYNIVTPIRNAPKPSRHSAGFTSNSAFPAGYISTCYSRGSTGVNNESNEDSLQFSYFSFRVLVHAGSFLHCHDLLGHSLMLLVTPVTFLQWQVKKKTQPIWHTKQHMPTWMDCFIQQVNKSCVLTAS